MEALRGEGVDVRLVRADAYPSRELAEERKLFVVISTQAEGELPDDVRGFVEFVSGRRAPSCRNCSSQYWDSATPATRSSTQWAGCSTRAWRLRRAAPVRAREADVDVATVAVLPYFAHFREQVRASSRPRRRMRIHRRRRVAFDRGKEQPYAAEFVA